LNSSFLDPSFLEDARNFDEYTQVLAGDTTNKMSFLGGEEGAALCIALLCTIVLRRRLSSKKRSIWAHQFVNVNNNNYTCCAKMAGKEETPKCRKKTVTRTNEMIEDLIDFIEIHPIVAFEAIYEPMLTSFWSLISFAVHLCIIMQYKGIPSNSVQVF
jgi:hypothetical protein